MTHAQNKLGANAAHTPGGKGGHCPSAPETQKNKVQDKNPNTTITVTLNLTQSPFGSTGPTQHKKTPGHAPCTAVATDAKLTWGH